MQKTSILFVALSLLLFISPSAHAQQNKKSAADCARITTGINGNLNGFVPFAQDSAWNQDISRAAADSRSDDRIQQYLNRIGRDPDLRGDFSSIYGESYNVVDSAQQPLRQFSIDGYPGESDIVPIPLPDASQVAVGSHTCPDGGDCHLLVLDRRHCWLYESWQTKYDGSQWHASNMAVWDLLSANPRPLGWTAADAAGLPVFSGLVRYDEVASGAIRHAFRFTLSHTGNTFVAPATHSAGYDSSAFPMGTRFRLKASFDVSGFSYTDQVILNAMKNYGLILADNGTDLEVAGAKDPRWLDQDVVALRAVHLSDFEVLASDSVMSRADLPSGPRPEIRRFNASADHVSPGQAVTLSWEGSPGAWYLIDQLGPVRGNSVTVTPTTTTTYTLDATNEYGRTQQSVTVQVW